MSNVVGIHNDYDELAYKSWSPFHAQASGMIAMGRPICALLTNLPILPVMEMADYRWARLFSLATVCLAATQFMVVCVRHLAVRPWNALMLALAIFLVPSFLYSVLATAAWAPHLVTICFALWGYAYLSRSNVQATMFSYLLRRRAFRELAGQAKAYLSLRQVVLAFVLLQIALYDYPPQAMVLACLPVITLLFSAHPPAYRILIALRDLVFIGANVALYALVAKLLYIPIVRKLVFPLSDTWAQGDLSAIEVRIAEAYRYSFNADPGEIFRRVGAIARVAGDLWFLPQFGAHVYVAAVILVVAVIAAVRRFLLGQRVPHLQADNVYMYGAVLAAVGSACFVLAGSAVIGAGGGFIAYRTVAMTIAIACVLSLFAIRYLGESLATATGASSLWSARAGDLVGGALVLTAIAAIYYDNHLTMRLSRNEHAYHEEMVRQALAAGANAIVLIDPGPFTLPEDHPAIFDQKGRAIPPYEVGCFSGYCVPTDSVFRVVAAELSYDVKTLRVWSLKGNDRGQGISCELLASSATYPPGAPERTKRLIDEIRNSRPAACFTYDLRWHDVGIDIAAKPQPVVMLRLAHE
ncbi:MAG: hypothetical protein WCP68_03005 [Enhydrobacter sp.]